MRGRASLVAALALALDQAAKWAAWRGLGLVEGVDRPVIDGVLVFRLAWNRGINFGLLQSGEAGRWLLIALALAVSAAVILGARRWWPGPGGALWAGLLAGGALSNALDRLLHGAVLDFLSVSCCGLRNPWSFNPADVFVFAGAFGLALFAGRGDKSRDRDQGAGGAREG
ncbi:MAG: signal peptidase II [Alphaproteobacteria bacterium]|nr:MAG: signal peptidase II [Alphaproteobacteria bacterium]